MASRSTNDLDPTGYRRVVLAVAGKFRGRAFGLEWLDLVQEGYVGLLLAKRRWSAKRPGEPMPSAYAGRWIRGRIQDATRSRRDFDRRRRHEPDLGLVASRPPVEIEASTASSLLGILTPRESALLVARLGLDGGKPLSYARAGESIGVGQTRARSLERKALSKLRSHLSRSLPI